MGYKTLKMGLIVLLGLLSISVGLTKVFADSVTVHVVSVRSGYWSSEGWVGSVNIEVNSVPYVEYCIEYDKYIYLGGTYTATVNPATDIDTWRSVSYILAWYALNNTLKPVDNNDEAYAIQLAIWKYTEGQWKTTNNPPQRAIDIYNNASGKDVARPDYGLTLTSESQYAPANVPVKITAQLTQPRQNILIQFSTDKAVFTENGENQIEKLTDNEGKAEVSVVCAEHGEVTVTATTRAYWAHILDLGDCQDLIAIGYPVQASIIIRTITFFVVPEVLLGALMAIIASFAALGILKQKRTKD
jgi:hypothetical protein